MDDETEKPSDTERAKNQLQTDEVSAYDTENTNCID